MQRLLRELSLMKSKIHTAQQQHILVHNEDSIVKVTLNRPEVHNCLTYPMLKTLAALVPKLQQAKAWWIEGAGDRAFCAGGDVKALFSPGVSKQYRFDESQWESTLNHTLAQIKTPCIANWDGFVMGGGYGITQMAHFRIATQNTVFAMPEGKLGFHTDSGAAYTLARLRSHIGYYLGLTGLRLKGEEVFLTGVANYYILREDIPKAYQQIKQAHLDSQDASCTISGILQKFHRNPKQDKIDNQDIIEKLFRQDSFHDIYQSVKDHPHPFAKEILKAMEQMCPLSVGVIHKLIKNASMMTHRQCLIQDFYLAQTQITDSNCEQGVHKVLIDRNYQPKWSHKHILDVSQKDVQAYFTFPPSYKKLQI